MVSFSNGIGDFLNNLSYGGSRVQCWKFQGHG